VKPVVRRRIGWLALIALLLLAGIAYAAWQQWLRTNQPPVGEQPWEIAFTAPDTGVPPWNRTLDQRLVQLIERSTHTLDIAIYDFDLADIAEAIARAAERGVRVRLVTDSDTLDNTADPAIQSAFSRLIRAGIVIVPDERASIMHNKFTVVDGTWVETGSWNYTEGDTRRLDNNQVIFRSPELAQQFTDEMERLLAPRRPRPPVSLPLVELPDTRIEAHFSPDSGIAALLAQRIQQVQRRVHFLAFSFTEDGIGQALLDRWQAGSEVEGVFESSGASTSASELRRLQAAGVPVYQDGNPYFMHHKVMLLDDRVTVFGSFNFSRSADSENDENLLFVENEAFTARFEQEFQRVLRIARQQR